MTGAFLNDILFLPLQVFPIGERGAELTGFSSASAAPFPANAASRFAARLTILAVRAFFFF
jgi:hypothetical protein